MLVTAFAMDLKKIKYKVLATLAIQFRYMVHVYTVIYIYYKLYVYKFMHMLHCYW